jgi:hypothetical protein
MDNQFPLQHLIGKSKYSTFYILKCAFSRIKSDENNSNKTKMLSLKMNFLTYSHSKRQTDKQRDQ